MGRRKGDKTNQGGIDLLSLSILSLSLTFLPMVDGAEEEDEVGAWLRRSWMASTEEGDAGVGGQIDEGRDGGREEASSEGGCEGGAASVVVPSPLDLCEVGGGKKGREERRCEKERG